MSFVIENFFVVFFEGFNDSVVSKDKWFLLMGIFFYVMWMCIMINYVILIFKVNDDLLILLIMIKFLLFLIGFIFILIFIL